ncbi:MAG TPA: ABC transporter substrate-binding protein [Phototrophicaceae bacterium]|nr:ABC transporter substrate-binding protein [Phototrophicaceae bacterium]
MNKNISRRKFLTMAALAGAGVAGASMVPQIFAQEATATPEATAAALPPAPAPGPLTADAAGGMDALVAAANKEGGLSVIALPDDWADYKDMKDNFKAKYPDIAAGFQDLNPDGSSAQEVAAIQANAGNSGPQNPDVIDVGFAWGAQAKAAGLLQPYKVATWDTIPDSLKDPDGYWYGDYYGKISFEVNADQVTNVPQDWSDLLKPEYKGLIAMPSDPSTAAEAAYVVWLAALANGGSVDDPTPGMEFFKKLAESGNLILTRATAATVARGDTPITMRWDYNALADRDANKDTANVSVAYPTSGTIAGVYVQAISAYAPRPNAARVWMEYLYSDEGQLVWYKGYATPVRYDDLVKRNVVPADLMSKFPKADVPVALPTLDQVNKALATINAQWNSIVGVTVNAS